MEGARVTGSGGAGASAPIGNDAATTGDGATTGEGATDSEGAAPDEGATTGSGAPSGSGGASAGRGPTSGAAGRVTAAGAGGGAGRPAEPTPTPCFDSFSFTGTWRGTMLDVDGTPLGTVVLGVVREGDRESASFTYGDLAPLPAPQDPSEPWPPGYWNDATLTDVSEPPALWPGFIYQIRQPSVGGTTCAPVIHVAIPTAELFEPWCALQTPVASDSGYACIERGDASSTNADGCVTYRNRVELGTYPEFMCAACGVDTGLGYCTCDATHCAANVESTFDYDFEVQSDDEIVGKDARCAREIAMPYSSTCRLHLTRTE